MDDTPTEDEREIDVNALTKADLWALNILLSLRAGCAFDGPLDELEPERTVH